MIVGLTDLAGSTLIGGGGVSLTSSSIFVPLPEALLPPLPPLFPESPKMLPLGPGFPILTFVPIGNSSLVGGSETPCVVTVGSVVVITGGLFTTATFELLLGALAGLAAAGLRCSI